MKKGLFAAVMSLVMAVSLLSAAFFTSAVMQRGKIKETEKTCRVISSGLYESIDKAISRPVDISLTMANDTFLQDMLCEEEKHSEKDMISMMKNYLSSVKKGLSVDTAFVVSDKSRRYYTYEGLNKVISPENDEHDVWYSIFVNGRKKYDFDVDVDQVNTDRWTVFLNTRIEDEEGNFLGVCGVGLVMTGVQETMQKYEDEYGVMIELTDSEGTTRVNTDSVEIDEANLFDGQYGKEHDGYGYTTEDGSYAVMRYIENLGWNLVVEHPPVDDICSSQRLWMICMGVLAVNISVFFIGLSLTNKKPKIKE